MRRLALDFARILDVYSSRNDPRPFPLEFDADFLSLDPRHGPEPELLDEWDPLMVNRH